MDYESFGEQTKKYMNKVMDVYSALKEQVIVERVRNIFLAIDNYTFSRFDKKFFRFLLPVF